MTRGELVEVRVENRTEYGTVRELHGTIVTVALMSGEIVARHLWRVRKVYKGAA